MNLKLHFSAVLQWSFEVCVVFQQKAVCSGSACLQDASVGLSSLTAPKACSGGCSWVEYSLALAAAACVSRVGVNLGEASR